MSSPSSDTLVSFGGNAVKIISDHSLFRTTLQTHFRHCNSKEAEILSTFQITTSSDTKFTGSIDGVPLFSNLGYKQALWVVMNEVITRLNADSYRGLVFHAAALTNANDAIIFCGKSGSGKSSLAAWLTADGFQYLTDEVIEMPLQERLIYGLTRSIVLKRDSSFIWQRRLPDKESQGFTTFEDGSAWIDPVLFHSKAIIDVALPRVIVFPQYSPEAPLHTTKLTCAETLFRLLQTLVNARNLPGHGMEATTQLAQQVTAYALTYSDIEEATDWSRHIITA